MRKRKEIVIPILNDEFKVIVCFGSPKQVEKVLKSWGHSNTDIALETHTTRGLCFYTRGCHPVIALPRIPRTASEIGTLSHEAVHAVEFILDYICQDVGGEILAHSVGAIVRNTLKTIKYGR